jgi:hypothetical protein
MRILIAALTVAVASVASIGLAHAANPTQRSPGYGTGTAATQRSPGYGTGTAATQPKTAIPCRWQPAPGLAAQGVTASGYSQQNPCTGQVR